MLLGTLIVFLPLGGHIFDNKEIDQRNFSHELPWRLSEVTGVWAMSPGNAEPFKASTLVIFTFIKMKKISKNKCLTR